MRVTKSRRKIGARRRPMTDELAITVVEVSDIVAKAWNCFSLGLIDAKTANKIRRTARKVVVVFRARIYVSPAKLELRHETLPTDIAELREADGMLSDLLASRTKISIEEDDKIVN